MTERYIIHVTWCRIARRERCDDEVAEIYEIHSVPLDLVRTRSPPILDDVRTTTRSNGCHEQFSDVTSKTHAEYPMIRTGDIHAT
jgi:hypothetical protein